MPYIIILKVRNFHQSTRNCFGTAREKPVGGGGGGENVPPPSLNRVKQSFYGKKAKSLQKSFFQLWKSDFDDFLQMTGNKCI